MEYSHDRRSYGPGNYFYKDRYYQQSHGQGNYQTKSRTYLPTLPIPLFGFIFTVNNMFHYFLSLIVAVANALGFFLKIHKTTMQIRISQISTSRTSTLSKIQLSLATRGIVKIVNSFKTSHNLPKMMMNLLKGFRYKAQILILKLIICCHQISRLARQHYPPTRLATRDRWTKPRSSMKWNKNFWQKRKMINKKVLTYLSKLERIETITLFAPCL